jgi:arsenate reductase
MNKLKILFVSSNNTCRSIIASAIGNNLYGNNVSFHAAGISNASSDPYTLTVLEEIGITGYSFVIKNIKDLNLDEFDIIITLSNESARYLGSLSPDKRILNISFDNPLNLHSDSGSDEDIISYYRLIRDEIKIFLDKLPTILTNF